MTYSNSSILTWKLSSSTWGHPYEIISSVPTWGVLHEASQFPPEASLHMKSSCQVPPEVAPEVFNEIVTEINPSSPLQRPSPQSNMKPALQVLPDAAPPVLREVTFSRHNWGHPFGLTWNDPLKPYLKPPQVLHEVTPSSPTWGVPSNLCTWNDPLSLTWGRPSSSLRILLHWTTAGHQIPT